MAAKKPENMTFEAAMQELETIIDSLENGNIALEESLKQFERGISLVRASQQRLENAQQKVQYLTEENTLEDFETEEGE